MEQAEKDYIRSRLYELSENLKCTPKLLNFFFSKRVLSAEDIEIIENKVTSFEKSQELFRFIQTKHNAFKFLLHGLQETGQTGALQILAEGKENDDPAMKEVQRFVKRWLVEQSNPLTCCSLTEKSSKRNIKFDVLHPVPSFTGRTKELEQLHKIVLGSQGGEMVSVVSQVTSVSGLGGIGKTQLAREYARIKGMEFDGNVLWMNAESEESLHDSFRRLARDKLNIPTQDKNGQMISSEVYGYFECMKALFVFDNAEKVLWLKQFIPQIEDTKNLFFLITSRDREWDRGIEILSLDGLSEEESVDLIKNGIKIISNDLDQCKSVETLAQTLQYFPLALQQAIAYIYEQKRTRSDYSADTYLEEFKAKQQELLSYREENAIFDDIFTATTATTWRMTFDKIKEEPNNGTLASQILNVIAYLGADNIRMDLFYRLRQKHWLARKILKIAANFGMLNERRHLVPIVCSIKEIDLVNREQTKAAVRVLVKYSMLKEGDGQNILSVHRLVQSVMRNQLTRVGMEETYLEIAMKLLQGNDDFPANNIGHALIVWSHAYAYSQINRGYARQVERILWKMREVGHYDEGVRFGNEALGKLKEVIGEKHWKFLSIQRITGLILQEQGHYEKAQSVFQDVLSKAYSLHGENSDIFLATKEDLGMSLRRSGKKQEALKILREVLQKQKIIDGINHSNTLITEENYGLALLDSGKLTEAEKTFQRIMEIYIERGDENSTDVLHLKTNLSIIYSRKRDNEKALEIHREVYKKLSPVWTENVNLFAVVCFNLGSSLNKVGKHEEVLKILEGNIEKIKKQFGSQHARTLQIQQQIGRSYLGLGNYSKALEILQSVYEAFVSVSGEHSLRSLNVNLDVAITLSLLGEHSKALSKFLEILPKMEALLGKENHDVLIPKCHFALAIERSAKNLHTALDLLKQAKAALIPIVGLDSFRVKEISNDIERIEKKTETA